MSQSEQGHETVKGFPTGWRPAPGLGERLSRRSPVVDEFGAASLNLWIRHLQTIFVSQLPICHFQAGVERVPLDDIIERGKGQHRCRQREQCGKGELQNGCAEMGWIMVL